MHILRDMRGSSDMDTEMEKWKNRKMEMEAKLSFHSLPTFTLYYLWAASPHTGSWSGGEWPLLVWLQAVELKTCVSAF
jgi:hypothetical protein